MRKTSPATAIRHWPLLLTFVVDPIRIRIESRSLIQ